GVAKGVARASGAAPEEASDPYDPIRKSVYDAIAGGQPARTSSDELIKSSNAALDRLAQVANIVLAAAERHAALKIDEANRNLTIHGAILGFALLAWLLGVLVVVHRVTGPIQAITDVMRRLAHGDSPVAIPGTAL